MARKWIFFEKERAALILIEEITLIAQQHFPDSAYQKQQKYYPMQKLLLLNGSRL
jgi:alkylhydroperoxidase family enzyme